MCIRNSIWGNRINFGCVSIDTTRLWFLGQYGAKHVSMVLDPPAFSRQCLGVSISSSGHVVRSVNPPICSCDGHGNGYVRD